MTVVPSFHYYDIISVKAVAPFTAQSTMSGNPGVSVSFPRNYCQNCLQDLKDVSYVGEEGRASISQRVCCNVNGFRKDSAYFPVKFEFVVMSRVSLRCGRKINAVAVNRWSLVSAEKALIPHIFPLIAPGKTSHPNASFKIVSQPVRDATPSLACPPAGQPLLPFSLRNPCSGRRTSADFALSYFRF